MEREARYAESERFVGRIESIADDRMVNRFQVHPNLMCPPSFWGQLEQRVSLHFSDSFIARESVAQPPLRLWLGAPEAEVLARAADVEVYDALLLARYALHDSNICFFHFPIRKRFS